jgi:hypothetical protein
MVDLTNNGMPDGEGAILLLIPKDFPNSFAFFNLLKYIWMYLLIQKFVGLWLTILFALVLLIWRMAECPHSSSSPSSYAMPSPMHARGILAEVASARRYRQFELVTRPGQSRINYFS